MLYWVWGVYVLMCLCIVYAVKCVEWPSESMDYYEDRGWVAKAVWLIACQSGTQLYLVTQINTFLLHTLAHTNATQTLKQLM